MATTRNERYDVAIIGGGLNGLATAAYLARAGKSVAVFEARGSVGGTMSTVEIAPGFRAPAVFDTVEMVHPSLISELGLAGHGLNLISGQSTTVFRGGVVNRVESDDPALAELGGFVRRLGEALERVWAAPLPDAEPVGLGGIVDVLRMGWALRRLGKKEFPEALRFLPMCVYDILDETLTDDALKVAVAASALRAAWMAPRSPGSAYGLVHHCPPWAGGLVPLPVFAEGGPGAVTAAVSAAATAAGAHVETSARVTRVRMGGDSATGVELGDRVVEAGLVVSALDPKTTLLDLVGARWMDPDFVERTLQVRARGGLTVIRLALDKLPSFTGMPDAPQGRMHFASSLDDIELAWDAAKYGGLPKHPLLTCTVPSAIDETLAPAGRHVMVVHAQFTPHTLSGGSWAKDREAFGDRVVASLDAYAPGLASSVLHRQVVSPADLEAEFGLSGGCVHHADLSLDQLLYMRPIPGWYGYRMPVEGLYLCGPGTHPGGAGTGLSGRNAAKQILADLKA